MEQPVLGQVAVVTGGGSGIGRAICHRLAAEGARVVVADIDEDRAASVAAELETPATHARVDVCREAEMEATVDVARSSFGRLDLWCNNAGIPGARGSLLDTSVDDWDLTMAVLLRSVFLGTKHAGRAFREQGGGGCIVNTASIAALTGGAGPPAYASAKAAVVQFTRYAAVELAPLRVRVNAVCPGAILTPMVDRGVASDIADRLRQSQPWPDHGEPSAVAAAVAYLASDDAWFVTGEALVVDGGSFAAGVRLAPLDPEAKAEIDLGLGGEVRR